MAFKSQKLTPFFAHLAIVVSLDSCALVHTSKQDEGHSGGATRAAVIQWDGLGAQQFKPTITSTGDINELMLSLATCECASLASAKILAARAIAPGVLPQVFVPEIRKAIASDSNLKILNSLPSILGDPLKGYFSSDEKLATKIRDSISEKLNASLASIGATSFGTRQSFRLDLFDPVAGNPATFDVSAQVIRWNLVAGRSEMWNGARPLDGVDHGLQLLETTRMIAEWGYMFGVGNDASPNGYGGLVLNTATGNDKLMVPVNPATLPDNAGIFASGTMSIAYPNLAAVKLATEVRETWTFHPNSVSLLTLARLWNAAALSFMNFRFDRSSASRNILQAPNGSLHASVLESPLPWLGGMNVLLKSRLIDFKARIIHEDAYGSLAAASLPALIALANALQNWRSATTNIQTSGLNPNLVSKLINVPNDLVAPIQLTVQNILATYTFEIDNPSPKIYVGSNQIPAAPKLAADTIATLAYLEQKTLQSPELRNTIFSLYASHIADWSKQHSSADAATVIAELHLAHVIAAYGPAAPQWAPTIAQNLESAVQVWSNTP